LSTLAKVLTILILVFSIAFAVATATLFSQQENYKEASDKAQAAIAAANAAEQQARQDATRATEELATATNRHAQNLVEKDRLLLDLKTLLQISDESVKAFESKIADLTTEVQRFGPTIESNRVRTDELQLMVLKKDEDLKTVSDDRRDLITQVAALTRDATIYEQQIGELRKQVVRLDTKIALMEGRTPFLATEPAVIMQATPTGTITQVKDTDWVQISIGTDDGVAVGYKYQVFRGTTYIGEILIIEVAKDSAVGRVTNSIGPVQTRDEVLNEFLVGK